MAKSPLIIPKYDKYAVIRVDDNGEDEHFAQADSEGKAAEIVIAVNSRENLLAARDAFRELYELCSAGVPLTTSDLDKALVALSATA